jgi:hypothetical protein
LTHGRQAEAGAIIDEIEGHFDAAELPEPEGRLTIHPHGAVGLGRIAEIMFGEYLKRTVFGLSLMISQAFLYNAFVFTYAMILSKFYDVPADRTGLYLVPFASATSSGRSCWAICSTRSAASR